MFVTMRETRQPQLFKILTRSNRPLTYLKSSFKVTYIGNLADVPVRQPDKN